MEKNSYKRLSDRLSPEYIMNSYNSVLKTETPIFKTGKSLNTLQKEEDTVMASKHIKKCSIS